MRVYMSAAGPDAPGIHKISLCNGTILLSVLWDSRDISAV